VLRYFSSYVSVSNGKVINITDPTLTYCPLARCLHKAFRAVKDSDKESVMAAIKNTIESKIKDHGFFTGGRDFSNTDITIPYGASEMMMFALREGEADAAVVVCDGAGTIFTDKPEAVQGIGARMNSLLATSPIKEIIRKLEGLGCHVVFDNALIDQVKGARDAIKEGYRKIVVTVSGHSTEDLNGLRALEKEKGVSIIALAVCTTGAGEDKITVMRDHADLIWGCASLEVRRNIGPSAIMQLSKKIPVFVMTKKGVDFVSAYSKDPEAIKSLDLGKQYLISNKKGGEKVEIAGSMAYISEARLPVHAKGIFNAKRQ
jgi:putative methanogenesis marker protein 8